MRPLLDDLELPNVQAINTRHLRVLAEHKPAGMRSSQLQNLGREPTVVLLNGFATGTGALEFVTQLDTKFRARQPVNFIADIASETDLEQVQIDDLKINETAGKPSRFEYSLELCEVMRPPESEQEVVEPVTPESPTDQIDQNVGTLVVDVDVPGQGNFDFDRVSISVEGTQDDEASLTRSLTNRSGNAWTEESFPAGSYTVEAQATASPTISGAASATVRPGATTSVALSLSSGAIFAEVFVIHFHFDSAFIEPCMRAVLRQVAAFAGSNANKKLVILGNTDLSGSDQYNQSLSERRARAALAYLTFGRDRAAAIQGWDALRRARPAGVLPSINDTWDVREYQHILQDLGYYSGKIDEVHGSATDAAVRAFQIDRGLSVDGDVGDNTWPVLIELYLAQDSLAVPESQLFPNAKEACDGGSLKWLGCGEKDPVKNTADAWRPNRRTEFVFVETNTLPCEVPQPDTFELPSSGAVGSTWCLGPGDVNNRCCMVVPHLVPGTNDPMPCPANSTRWCRRPAEPGSFVVRGSIKREDGSPLANHKYVLIAPDGEFMDGERPSGARGGRPIAGRTNGSGEFSYPNNQKGIGVYVLEVDGRFLARASGTPADSAKGPIVCKRLDGSAAFDVVVVPNPADPSRAGGFHVGEDDHDRGTFDIPPIAGESNRTITVGIRALIRYPAESSGRRKAVSSAHSTYPLVMIAHGNHRAARANGTPIHSHEGLEYLARHLASHGYIAVSMDHNDINQAGVGAKHRARATLEHLEIMEDINSSHPRLAGKVDLDKIALIGHSQGGLGIAFAQQFNNVATSRRNIRALVAIAPTDDDSLQLPATPTVVLLGSADQDVGESSAEFYDQVGPPKSMIYIHGGIHNFFNTHPDWVRPRGVEFGERDIANRDARVIRPVDHLNFARGYSLAFLELSLRGVAAFRIYFQNQKRPDRVAGIESHRQVEVPGALTVDDFEQEPQFIPKFPDQSGDAINTLGFPIIIDRLRYEEFIQFNHDTRVGFIDWDSSQSLDGVYRTSLRADDSADPRNVSAFSVLSLRAALEMRNRVNVVGGSTGPIATNINPPNQPQRFLTTLVDSSDRTASVRTDVIGLIPYPYLHHGDVSGGTISTNSIFIFKTLRIPLSSFLANNARLNLNQLVEVRFEFQQTPSGGISIDTIQFSQ